MNRSSIFKRKIDFEKSHGSYLVDKDTNDEYLDFFGQYATLTLSYNHPIFKSHEYLDEISRVAHQKITNCEILSDESAEFDELFRSFASKGIFSHYHYSCTGALAIEAAIKTSMDYKGPDHQRVISFKGSFHGINSYGGILTDRFEPVNQRIKGFPGSYWEPIDNPMITYDNGPQVWKQFEWSSKDNNSMTSLNLFSDTGEVAETAQFTGPWALLHLLALAKMEPISHNTYRFVWHLRDGSGKTDKVSILLHDDDGFIHCFLWRKFHTQSALLSLNAA